MKFKTSQFTGYNKHCHTIQSILNTYKGKFFTLEEIQKQLGTSMDNVFEHAVKYAKTKELKLQIVEHYWNGQNYSIAEIKKLIAQESFIKENYDDLKNIPILKNENKFLKQTSKGIELLKYGRKDYISEVQVSMQIIWNATQNSYRTTNHVMQEQLSNLIKAGVEFDIEDFNFIKSHFNAGYWYSNLIEMFYRECIECNPSAVKSFEHAYQRVPFILNNKRMYVGRLIEEKIELPKNRYKRHYYFITSFTDDHKRIRIKSSSDYEAKKDYKLHTFTKEEFKAFFKDKNIEL